MNATIQNKHRTGETNDPLARALLGRLLSLRFDAYLKVVALLLARLGYRDIELAGRRDWKGRNKGGGFDLLATAPGGLSSRRVIVQAKQFDGASRVFQRHADELRGAAIRTGATEALLVTSGPVSKSIDLEVLAFPLAPVRLLSSDQLLELLTVHQIGVTPNGALDEDFFTRLESDAVGNRQADCLGSGSEIRVRVEVQRVSKRQLTSHS